MKLLKFFGGFVAILYDIVFFLVLNVFLLLFSLSGILKPETLVNVVKNIDLNTISISINDEDSQNTQKEIPLDVYLKNQLVKTGLPENEATKIVNDEAVREMIGDLIGDSLEYYLYGENTVPQLDKNKLKQLINKYELSEMLESNNINIDSYTDVINEEFTNSIPTRDEVVNNIPKEVLDTIEFINSSTFIYVFISFIIISFLLFALLTWSFIKPFNLIGIPAILDGILLLLLRVLSGSIIGFMSNVSKGILNTISNILPKLLKPLLFNSLACLILGILCIVINIILNKKKNKKETDSEPNFDIEENSNQSVEQNNNQITQ